jgi:hypothetical protein
MSDATSIERANIQLEQAFKLLASILDARLTGMDKQKLTQAKRLIASAAQNLADVKRR